MAEATNITMKSRRSILNAIKGIDCEKVCVVIVKPIDECRKDNIGREHPVPDYVIEKQARKFQIPFLEEGWDKIEFVDHIHNKDEYNYRLESTWVSEIYNDFDQKNPYHMESLGKHMTDAYEFFQKRFITIMQCQWLQNIMIWVNYTLRHSMKMVWHTITDTKILVHI